jgi:hypothetical protein
MCFDAKLIRNVAKLVDVAVPLVSISGPPVEFGKDLVKLCG